MQGGYLEVIVGSMFSGKTEELIRLLRRAELAHRPYQVFKPRIDNRYSDMDIASHSSARFPATVIDRAADIWGHLKTNTEIVGIDEGQFFGGDLLGVCNRLADRGLRVIVAGLDTNWMGEPFHPMPELMAAAEIVHKQHAVCVVCGANASRTQRRVRTDQEVLVGSSDLYEARCRTCFDPHLRRTNEVKAHAGHELMP